MIVTGKRRGDEYGYDLDSTFINKTANPANPIELSLHQYLISITTYTVHSPTKNDPSFSNKIVLIAYRLALP